MKKVGKTTRPFRYDLNQIPNDYTVEVRNRFKGLDLIDRVPDELWTEVYDIIQEISPCDCVTWRVKLRSSNNIEAVSVKNELETPMCSFSLLSSSFPPELTIPWDYVFVLTQIPVCF